MADRSSRPVSCPHQAPEPVERAVLELRREHPRWGSARIRLEMLRTGPAAYHPSIRDHLGLAPNETVVGFVYLGYPSAEREATERAPASERTRWLGDDPP